MTSVFKRGMFGSAIVRRHLPGGICGGLEGAVRRKGSLSLRATSIVTRRVGR